MNNKKFSEAMNELDDKYIEKAANYQAKKSKPVWIKYGAVAACLAVIVFAGIKLFPQSNNGLPMLTLPEDSGAAMGFEGRLGYDMTEWDNGNPWDSSMGFDTLPVYKNASYNAVGMPVGLSEEAMMERLEKTVQALGMENYQIEKSVEESSVVEITAEAEELKVEVDATGTIEILFEDGLELPDEYSFAYFDITPAQAEQALEYLTGQYAHLLGFEQPQMEVSTSYILWNDYDEDGNYLEMPKCEYSYRVYDATGDDLEDILNYTYRYAQFAPDDDGNLMMIRLYDSLCCAEKLGDYPIITMDKAYDLLLNGNYVTSVPYEITDPELVRASELVYRNSRLEETFLPYYRFYVELPDMRREDGLVDFGAYYVPAVQGEYITNMPIWNGSIN